MFHVSNLKKCLSNEPLAIPLDEIHIDDKLHFVEEPVKIMDREVKRLKQSRIPNIKVRLNSRRGPEFTLKREDQFRKKCVVEIMDDFNLVVYAPHDVRDKRMLWDYLTHVTNQWDGEVVMMEEVPLGGSAYTWCHKSATKMSKLDRFLVSENLLNTFPNINVITLDQYLSDYRPILLREALYDYGPIPFRFFHYWLEADGLDNFVIDSWNGAPGDGSNAIRNFLCKLKFLKLRIRGWYADYRNNTKGVFVKFKEELRVLDEAIDKGNGSDEIVTKRLEVLNKLQHASKVQASEVAQKAKIKWSVEGDENMKFFHGMLNKKRSQLNIRGVMINGTWTDKPDTVKQEFFHHFRSRFDKPSDHRARIDMCFPNSLSTDQQEDLERMVSKEEVKRAVFGGSRVAWYGYNTLWSDGFTFGFYRHFWSTIENDVFEAVNLIGSMYKIIAKILTNRLVGVLGDIVNEVQSAFIAERQILDGPFILNEVMQWCRMKKKQALIFKVDFEKAYDSVRWDFLDDVLYNFGFGNKWRAWIQSCLRSSRGSILINGSPTEEFQFFKGLKQGDPLSPFLFILIMESLHLSFQRVVDAGMFTGIRLSSMLNLSHLFYADDAIFLGQWSDTNIDTLVHVLECFHRASGLRINMCKSKIMGIHVDDGKIKMQHLSLGV
ncbi:RNA-directed DNA polymerase, eukaryota [Tanacetum coccineum]|uniref:RNA-directed DNA polymerase, eukaryota n=1 Tax=Tanacetum coccineum TaxID=301880 RepID=A0ABQ5EQD5_9ASTR